MAALSLPFTLPSGARAATAAPSAPVAGAASGGTRSLPLAPLAADRALGGAPARGLTQRHVSPFSLLGVAWDDPDARLDGRVQVRTRPAGGTTWSRWRDVPTHAHDHAPDPGSAERAGPRVGGATAPLWVGRSDGVQVRVTPAVRGGKGAPAERGSTDAAGGGGTDAAERGGPGAAGGRGTGATGGGGDGAGRRAADGVPTGADAEPVSTGPVARRGDGGPDDGGTGGAASPLPDGLRLELVDPGTADGAPAVRGTPAATASTASTVSAAARAGGAAAGRPSGAASAEPGTAEPVAASPAVRDAVPDTVRDAVRDAVPDAAPRPVIVSRADWGADESLRESGFRYTGTVKAAFVHHTDTGNDYTCAQAAEVVRGIYRYHVETMGWRDIGYNFLVDKCGTVYEGRAGGVEKAVMGAHTMGFNTDSTGMAVLGTFTDEDPPQAAVDALAGLAAWKLGLTGADPAGTTSLTSAGGNLFPAGEQVRMNVVSGHRDGYNTDCPGTRLYGMLGTVRSSAAALQGR
ncbi:hypothetical protein GCM10018793_33400 [Streptomyces sulfonofaciens]|uniref:Peptidoglycan recognition protein family domain-containing protein n=1 Tax=Streptomyces sulfonofaciens TaxID=68272 RepID=A0A919G8U3_9ACTN|nr:peptidoglycan recognition protein [Streptomyces sulfonofaciens]GHH79829.1 hypothetical protein GCM10018793_33400 [Streptomyces sulfonofaciens]